MAQSYNQVKLATTENVNLSAVVQTGVTKIDGVIVNANDRILVKAQTDKKKNGIYTISLIGTWVRASDFATTTSQAPGAWVIVTQGDSFADTGWVISSDEAITVDTTNIEFERITLNLKAVSGDVPSNIVLRSVKGYPLTNSELDNNFKFLAVGLTQKLNILDFNPLSIVSKINTLTPLQTKLNAYLLRGNAPSDTAAGNSIALRDASGNITTNIFIGNLQGNATTATSATFAATSGNVSGVITVANGGTGSNNAASARIALGAVGKSGDIMTGKLSLPAAIASNASLNIAPGIEPINPNDGDIWMVNDSLYYSSGEVTQKIARVNSPEFIGNPIAPTASVNANSDTLATTAFVKNVKTLQIDPAIALKANNASPILTGDPKAPTALITNISTSIANTQFVKDYSDSRFTTYDKWGTSRKFVQSTDPGGAAVDGDFWFKV